MSRPKRILYIHEEPPAEGLGCGIVVRRHLKRLEAEGWEIGVACSEDFADGFQAPAGWRVARLPKRRWWWPPCRSTLGFSHGLRLGMVRRELEQALHGWIPDAVTTQLYRRYPLLSVQCARAWGAKLGVFVFDEREVWEGDPAERERLRLESAHVLDAADRVWAVSDEMRSAYAPIVDNEAASRFSVLRPIPEGRDGPAADWTDRFAKLPVIAHAGSLHDFHLPAFRLAAEALARVNGELLVVGDKNNGALQTLMTEHGNVRQQDFLPQDQLLPFFIEHAAAGMATYAFDLEAQPWARCSFPSKFVEFCHTGLPMLLIAPEGTAIHSWAAREKWDGLIDRLESESADVWISGLTRADRWRELAAQTKRAAEGEFDPERIQKQFCADLEGMTVREGKES